MARKGKSQRQDTYEETEKDKIQELKSIVRKQTKTIKQLRRQLQKQRNVEEDYDALVEEVEHMVPPKAPEKERCPDCSDELKRLELGKFTLIHCMNCGYRKRVKSEK